MKYIYLSYDLYDGSPVYKGLKAPHIVRENIISSNGYNTSIICAENHAGTHVDAPRHFLEGGKSISDYGLEELILERILLWDCIPDQEGQITADNLRDYEKKTNLDLNSIDCLLLRTGFYKYRDLDLEKYLMDNPGISPDFIDYTRRNFPNIRALGIDAISISSYGQPEMAIKAHQTAFLEDDNYGEPLLLIEDMKLQEVPSAESIEKLFIIPWQIKGVDSAPCSIMAQIK